MYGSEYTSLWQEVDDLEERQDVWHSIAQLYVRTLWELELSADSFEAEA